MVQQTEPHPENRSQTCCLPDFDLSTGTIDDAVAVFSALANPTRYGIIRLLVTADGEVCACNLGPPLDVSQSAVSHALSRLYEAGLVDRRKQGRWRYYQATSLAETVIDSVDIQEARR